MRRDRWLRAVGYGLLAEISTIVTIIAIVMIYRYVFARGLTDADYTAFAERVGAIVGIVGGSLYTFLFARLLMQYLSTRFVAHGIVVRGGVRTQDRCGRVGGISRRQIETASLSVTSGAVGERKKAGEFAGFFHFP